MLGASVGNMFSCSNGEPNRGVVVSGRGSWRWVVPAGTPAPPPPYTHTHTFWSHNHKVRATPMRLIPGRLKRRCMVLSFWRDPFPAVHLLSHWRGLCHLPLSTAKESGKLHIFSWLHCQAKQNPSPVNKEEWGGEQTWLGSQQRAESAVWSHLTIT